MLMPLHILEPHILVNSELDRDIVGISLSYFDRYLSRHTSIDETLYQLVALTSLYLAVKLHSTRKISISSMSELSKGHFRVDQIKQMEIFIIKTLRWRLNPPTPTILLNIASPIIHALVNSYPGNGSTLNQLFYT